MTTTPNLGIDHVATGQAAKEVPINEGFDDLDTALTGNTTISSSGGTVTLSAAEALSAALKIEGALASALTVYVPDAPKAWMVRNDTTGDYDVTVAIDGGSPSSSVVIAQGDAALVYYDGTTIEVISGNTGRPYDIALFFPGKPSAGQTILRIAVSKAFTIDADWGDSVATAGTAATGSAVFEVKKNGTTFATVTYSGASGTFDMNTSPDEAYSFAKGDILSIVGPSPADITLADIGVTIAATRV